MTNFFLPKMITKRERKRILPKGVDTMQKANVIELKQGDHIKVDQQVVGYTIEGPALVKESKR